MFKLKMQPHDVISEAIKAAQIAANATIKAAIIQGVLTFAAGAFAILVGFFAIKAAARQVRLEESKHQDRVAAYRVRLEGIVKDLERRSQLVCDIAAMTLKNFRQHGDTVPLAAIVVTPVPDLSSAQWEGHALLGPRAVRAIIRVSAAMDQYILFRQDVIEKGLQSGGTSKFSSVTITPDENGGTTISYTPAAELNMEFAKEFQAAVHDLKSAIVANKGAG